MGSTRGILHEDQGSGMTVGIAIITHRARDHLPYCLPPLLASPLKPRIVVVNSSSGDGTVELAEEMRVETLVIPREEFNHGTTREKARQWLGCDIVVMMTPDAYPASSEMLGSLVAPIMQKKAAIAYARQIPHEGAKFFEAFSRSYSYPVHSHMRALADTPQFGVYTIFCSDSCAAYSNEALDQIGGFPPVLLGEDTLAAAKILKKGRKIAYVAEAVVRHSHSYSLVQEFRRHFDIGLARKEFQEVIEEFGTDSKRGRRYAWQMAQQLYRENPFLLPYGCAHTLAKWLGYKMGRMSLRAPKLVKKLFSSQDFYWK